MSSAELAVAPGVAWVDDAELPDAGERPGPLRAAYVARLPDGVPLVLEGPAWAVWRAVADGAGDLEAVTAAAALLMDTPVTDAVRADVSGFVDQLLAAGLVVRAAR